MLEAEVIDELMNQHELSPEYCLKEESEAAFLQRHQVPLTEVKATYVQHSGPRSVLWTGTKTCGVEEFVAGLLRRNGFHVLRLESRPIHALFGIYMWLTIQDPADPLVRIVGFDRKDTDTDQGEHRIIWTSLPEDFGSPEYGIRRKAAIQQHLDESLRSPDDLDWLFDYWLEPSNHLRQYLWAYKEEQLQAARQIIRILSMEEVKTILSYLAESYWERYCGWPDLLAWRGADRLFIEVKGSKDKLSMDQRTWVEGNQRFIRLPFNIYKIHRAKVVSTSELPGWSTSLQ